jgi:hypothetical protein
LPWYPADWTVPSAEGEPVLDGAKHALEHAERALRCADGRRAGGGAPSRGARPNHGGQLLERLPRRRIELGLVTELSQRRLQRGNLLGQLAGGCPVALVLDAQAFVGESE